MKKKKRTEINLEIEEALTIRTRRALRARCPQCQRHVRMVPANEAAIIAGLSAREIYRQVEAGWIHFVEDQRGMLYVCSESLEKRARLHEGELS